ncbi:hypothetical protein SLW70_12415 [Flavobacterium sp. NG2]|nr:hypothetical protein [Flavobacterium sp. NG2]WPR70730.1 hypothetical protein SLW70_12415 [Flavobacterium sp. NG2]
MTCIWLVYSFINAGSDWLLLLQTIIKANSQIQDQFDYKITSNLL